MSEITQKLWEVAIQYGPQILLALLALVVGLPVIKILMRLVEKAMDRKAMDMTGKKFILGVLKLMLQFSLFLVIAQTFGMQITSLVAVLGAAGLAIGLSLKDSLANFAAGFMMVYFKPFKVGDFIETQGQSGTVKEIQIFCTVLTTPDNKRIIIPNGPIMTGTIVNYSAESTRRVDLTFGIAYEDSIPKAKEIIESVLQSNDKIMKDPPWQIAVIALADSSVNLVVRVWSKKEDYWDVFFDLQERVKMTFDDKGISIPFPQRVIHQAEVSSGA